MADNSDNSCKRKASSPLEPSESQKIAKPPPNLNGPRPIVKIHVKANGIAPKRTFPVHKNYICYYSPFFDAAFNGNFTEGESQEIDLAETSPRIFGIFVNWLYSQRIQTESAELPDMPDLIRLWILADKILIPKLQNEALIAISESQLANEGSAPSNILKYVFENTTKESALRQYIIDLYANTTHFKISTPDNYPHEMLVAMIGVLRKNSKCRTARTRPWRPTVEELSRYVVDSPDEARNKRQQLENSLPSNGQADAVSPEVTFADITVSSEAAAGV